MILQVGWGGYGGGKPEFTAPGLFNMGRDSRLMAQNKDAWAPREAVRKWGEAQEIGAGDGMAGVVRLRGSCSQGVDPLPQFPLYICYSE